MQQLDAITLKGLATELHSLLENAKVSKVQHPSAHEFLITFWGGTPRPDNLNLLYIQLNPEAPFCALTQSKQKQGTVLQSFEKPTALCMLLRKHLNGASLQGVSTLPGERVLNLVFENFNELGNKVRLVLSLELMGKHSNMLLIDDVQGSLIAVAHGVSESMSSYRELAAGLSYAPPPRPTGKRLLTELTLAEFVALCAQCPDNETLPRFLNRQLAGVSQRVLSDAMLENPDPTELFKRLSELESGGYAQPAISPDGQWFSLTPPENWLSIPTINQMVSDYFIGQWQTIRRRRKSQQLTLLLDQQEKRRKRREEELIPIADSEIEALQATGDRLLAAFSAREIPAQPSGGLVTVTRYEDGSPWPIEVDPSRSWVENAQVYYRRAKKAKARKAIYEQMADALNSEREYLQTLRVQVEQADTLAQLQSIETEMANAGFAKAIDKPETGKSGKSNKPKKKTGEGDGKDAAGIISLRSSDGLEMLVGKSGSGNEAIVGRLSRPDDLWLHVHQMPGSHVLVRVNKELEQEDSLSTVPDQTLLEAATLAVYYSSARESLNVPVIYTESRYVRKIPHSYPGHVNYRQEKTVFITPDNALVQGLLKQ